MDPSYTNPFANGGTAGQVPVPMPNNTPVTGDIVLGGEKKENKSNKKWIVLGGGIFLVLLIICIIVSMIIPTNTKVSEAKEELSELLTYVRNMDQEIEPSNLNITEVFDNLNNKYENFKNKIDRTNKNSVEGLQGDLNALEEHMIIAQRAMAPEDTMKKIIDKYLESGKNAAEEEITNIINVTEYTQDLRSVLLRERQYYSVILSNYDMYAKASCAKLYELDFDCAVKFYGGSFELNRVSGFINDIQNSMQAPDILSEIQDSLENVLVEISGKVEGK